MASTVDDALLSGPSASRYKISTSRPSRVEVHFSDGALERQAVEAPRGSEPKFASEGDVVEKFPKLGYCTYGDVQADCRTGCSDMINRSGVGAGREESIRTMPTRHFRSKKPP